MLVLGYLVGSVVAGVAVGTYLHRLERHDDVATEEERYLRSGWRVGSGTSPNA